MATIIKLKNKALLKKRLSIALKANNGGVDTRKYCGVIKLTSDPLKIQKELRDEWE